MSNLLTLRFTNCFNKYVIKTDIDTDCWKWSGYINNCGYGRISARAGKQFYKLAHRFSYEYHTGSIPEGLLVLHRCDNPQCTNPKHLFLGTHTENMQDMLNKGRNNNLKGEANGNSILNEQDVLYILANKNIKSCLMLAKQFKVVHATILNIWNCKTWKHLKRDGLS